MQSSTQRDVALAHAALEHASYFLKLDAPEQAVAYFQFAAKQFQKVSKSLVLQVVWEDSLRRHTEAHACELARRLALSIAPEASQRANQKLD